MSTLFTLCTVFLNINCKIMTPEHNETQWIHSIFPKPMHQSFQQQLLRGRDSKQLQYPIYGERRVPHYRNPAMLNFSHDL